MEKVKICECCGAKIVEYKHILNKGLVQALFELSKHNSPVPLTDLDITRNQWTNFQKLRYWGLVEKELCNNGAGTGRWFVTTIGREFINNGLGIPTIAWSFRGKPVKLEGIVGFFNEIYNRDYRRKPDYVADRVSHIDASAMMKSNLRGMTNINLTEILGRDLK